MRRIRECEVVDGESVSIDIREAVEELRRREVELRVFLDIGELDGSTLCKDRSVINSVDGEGLGGKGFAAIGVRDDVVKSDLPVEVSVRGEGVVALTVISDGSVVGGDAAMESELVGDSTSEKPERRSVMEKETSLSSVPLAMSVAAA